MGKAPYKLRGFLMTQHVAVFCALPPERNTGMATVDLAAHTRLRALAGDAKVTLYTYGSAGIYTYQKGELPFDHVDVLKEPEAFLNADAWVYWGDFVHTRAYWMQDRGAWDEQTAGMTPDALARWQEEQFNAYSRFLFLTGKNAQERAKAIVFGSTLITTTARDALDGLYWPAFKQFFSQAGMVLLRDALSAAKISPLRGMQASQGCDCAFLLTPEDITLLPGYSVPASRGGVGVFFGRSPKKWAMMKFAKSLAGQAGQELKWIPWFGTRRKSRLLAKLAGIEVPHGERAPGELLSMVAGCSFVITDTYHLCVNAWRMGIPAVCIGQGGGASQTSLSDKKKEILYEMLGARNFYVFVEALGSKDAASGAAAALADAGLVQAVQAAVYQQRDAAMERLKLALDKALGR